MPKKEQKPKKIRAAIYSRVSTQEQIERTEYDSMQSHMDRCKFYIKAQENWELVKIYKDPAESGDKWKRPDLQEMLYDVRNDEIDVVVTIKLDRISRSVQDFHRILEIFEENKVSLVSVTQGFDTGNRQAGLPLTGTPLEKGRMTHLPLRVLLSRGELQAVDRGLPKI